MSKYTAEQLIKTSEALCGLVGMADLTDAAGMLREYAAHLAAQAEWPSEGDVQSALSARLDEGSGAEVRSYIIACDPFHSREDVVRAALQSVRPPVGVGSDDYKEIARLIGSIFFFGDFKAETYNERELEKLLRKTGNFYDTQEQFDDASRHAPTKD